MIETKKSLSTKENYILKRLYLTSFDKGIFKKPSISFRQIFSELKDLKISYNYFRKVLTVLLFNGGLVFDKKIDNINYYFIDYNKIYELLESDYDFHLDM